MGEKGVWDVDLGFSTTVDYGGSVYNVQQQKEIQC